MSQEKRVALVIGNGGYQELSRLPHAVNDAEDMAVALEELGFIVIPGKNLDRRATEDAIITFGEHLQGGNVALFYFAGHGAQVSGENYLIPTTAQIKKDQHIVAEAVPLARVLQTMERAGNATNIVILDACRNNPFVSSFRSITQGLAPVRAPQGMLIAYATAPGDVADDGAPAARNGLYTEALLLHIRRPDVEVGDVFKRVGGMVSEKSKGEQVPWINISLSKDVYLAPSSFALHGNLQVHVNVDAAHVRINGDEAGIARREEPLRLRRLEAGTLTVRVEADGYEPVERPVIIAANEWTRETFVLQRREAPPEETLTPQPAPAASHQPVSPLGPCPQPEAQSPDSSVIIWVPDKTGKLVPRPLPPDQSAGGSGETQKK